VTSGEGKKEGKGRKRKKSTTFFSYITYLLTSDFKHVFRGRFVGGGGGKKKKKTAGEPCTRDTPPAPPAGTHAQAQKGGKKKELFSLHNILHLSLQTPTLHPTSARRGEEKKKKKKKKKVIFRQALGVATSLMNQLPHGKSQPVEKKKKKKKKRSRSSRVRYQLTFFRGIPARWEGKKNKGKSTNSAIFFPVHPRCDERKGGEKEKKKKKHIPRDSCLLNPSHVQPGRPAQTQTSQKGEEGGRKKKGGTALGPFPCPFFRNFAPARTCRTNWWHKKEKGKKKRGHFCASLNLIISLPNGSNRERRTRKSTSEGRGGKKGGKKTLLRRRRSFAQQPIPPSRTLAAKDPGGKKRKRTRTRQPAC